MRLHPPRASESEAREWPLTVVARSRALGVDVARAPATLTIQPFQDTVMRVGPERRRGRRRASFDVVVENRGNSPMEIAIDAADTAAHCPVTVTPERTIGAGRRLRGGGRAGRRAVPADLRAAGRPSPHDHAPGERRRVRAGAVAGDVPAEAVAALVDAAGPRSAGGVHHRGADAAPRPRGPQPHGTHRPERDQAAQASTTSRSVARPTRRRRRASLRTRSSPRCPNRARRSCAAPWTSPSPRRRSADSSRR